MADLFKHQSGEMAAVIEVAKEVLEATREVVEKVRSDPPSPRKGPTGGVYSSVEIDGSFLLEDEDETEGEALENASPGRYTIINPTK